VDVGLTVIDVAVEPVLHVYCVAPPPFIVVDVPEHIVELVGTAVTVKVPTFTIAVAGAPPQAPLVPFTVYVVLTAGLTVIVSVVFPVFHKYAVLPFAVSNTEPPGHIPVGEGLTTTVGVVVTVTSWVATELLLLQFPAPVPVTV
jgi:hypothetical protein